MAARRQVYRSVIADRRRTTQTIILILLLIFFLGFLMFGLHRLYSPPAHDKTAEKGAPAVDDSYLYKRIDSDFGYSFSLAANLYRQEDGSVNIFLTDMAENSVDLLCEIHDTDTGELLYKSGRICPGEYVKTLFPVAEFDNAKRDITVSVFALNSDTYKSEGTTELKLVLQPW